MDPFRDHLLAASDTFKVYRDLCIQPETADSGQVQLPVGIQVFCKKGGQFQGIEILDGQDSYFKPRMQVAVPVCVLTLRK